MRERPSVVYVYRVPRQVERELAALRAECVALNGTIDRLREQLSDGDLVRKRRKEENGVGSFA